MSENIVNGGVRVALLKYKQIKQIKQRRRSNVNQISRIIQTFSNRKTGSKKQSLYERNASRRMAG